MKKIIQVVVKWIYSNRIALYEFNDAESCEAAIKEIKKKKNALILTTNIAQVI